MFLFFYHAFECSVDTITLEFERKVYPEIRIKVYVSVGVAGDVSDFDFRTFV